MHHPLRKLCRRHTFNASKPFILKRQSLWNKKYSGRCIVRTRFITEEIIGRRAHKTTPWVSSFASCACRPPPLTSPLSISLQASLPCAPSSLLFALPQSQTLSVDPH